MKKFLVSFWLFLFIGSSAFGANTVTLKCLHRSMSSYMKVILHLEDDYLETTQFILLDGFDYTHEEKANFVRVLEDWMYFQTGINDGGGQATYKLHKDGQQLEVQLTGTIDGTRDHSWLCTNKEFP